MYKFLDLVPEVDLLKILNNEIGAKSRLAKRSDRETIYRGLFALFGYDILSNRKIREVMLLNSPDDIYSNFLERFNPPYSSKLDNCLNISASPWKPSSKIVKSFKSFFKITSEYIPKSSETTKQFEVLPNCKSLNELFDYQSEISDKICSFFESEKKASIMQMPTGSGKTRTIFDALTNYFVDYDHKKCIWLAHSDELLEQAIGTLKAVWGQQGNRDIEIGRLWGNNRVDEELLDVDFLFVGFAKFISISKNNIDFYNDLINSFDIFIVDEAHKSVSSSLGYLLTNLLKIENKQVLGLTATPGRSYVDSIENTKLVSLYKEIIGSEILGETPIAFLQKRGILANIIPIDYKKGVEVNLTQEDFNQTIESGDFTQKVLKKLADNRKRNEVIVDIIKEELSNNKKTLVFCCNVEHSKKIAVMLATQGIISASVDYKIKPNARKGIIEDFRTGKLQVLLNFGIFSTGLDIPDIDTVFITRPTSSIVLYSQMIGRGLRGKKVGGTEECRLINVRDNFSNFGDVDGVYNFFENDWS